MSNASLHPLELILRRCAEKAPDPWYPSDYAKETGNARDSLDPYLDQLRLGGLTRLTDWVAGRGQGYALTPAGEEILKNPRQLARLVAGKWSPPVVRENRPTATASSPWERGESVRQSLLYPVQPILTFLLIAINVAIFVIRYASAPLYEQIEDFAVAIPAGLLQGQWWRLLTTAFLHQNELHLGFNMYALYALGQNAERIWGHGRYLAIYVVGALGCTCLALAIQPVPCIGASGAICAIFAAEAAWVYYHRQHLDPRLFFAWQRNFTINLVLLVFISFLPRVSWQGHLGGAIAGFLIALWLNYFQFQPGWRRWLQWVGVLVIPLLSVGLLLRAMDRGSRWREIRDGVKAVKQIRDFNDYYLPQVQSSLREARQKQEQVNELIDKNPTRRDAEQVKQGIVELSAAIDSLDELAGEMRRAGPFVNPLAEEARIAGLKSVEAQLELSRLLKECLEKGKEWTERDEKRLEQQKEETKKAEREWQALVR
jgi:membrane associated rhomboid family serine protease